MTTTLLEDADKHKEKEEYKMKQKYYNEIDKKHLKNTTFDEMCDFYSFPDIEHITNRECEQWKILTDYLINMKFDNSNLLDFLNLNGTDSIDNVIV